MKVNINNVGVNVGVNESDEGVNLKGEEQLYRIIQITKV